MAFAGVNYLAVLVAGIAGWLIGAIYYTALAKPWVSALGKTMDAFKAEQAAMTGGRIGAMVPFVLALIAGWVMAYVLAGLIAHLGPGEVTVRNGLISSAFVWAGFVITTLAVNNAFAGPRYRLSVIDGGHWLLVLLAQGAIIGAFG